MFRSLFWQVPEGVSRGWTFYVMPSQIDIDEFGNERRLRAQLRGEGRGTNIGPLKFPELVFFSLESTRRSWGPAMAPLMSREDLGVAR